MRDYCLNCVIKHLGQAFVNNIEAENGYPDHFLLVFGHLAEASEECYGASIELAEEIRQNRMKLMEDRKYNVQYFELFSKIEQLIKEKGCGSCKKSSDNFKKRIEDKLKEE